MADAPKSDMFMQFTKKSGWKGGGKVNAECAADKSSEDHFMDEFTPQTYDTYSDFFEVTEFEFNVEVKDEDATKDESKQHRHSTFKDPKEKEAGKKKGGGQFLSWRSASDNGEVDKMTYPFQVKSFSFKRVIDSASIIFFDGCCGSVTFPSAIFVRRVSTGGNTPAQAFLRIEFQDVLITKLGWEDGDLLIEDCDFICRGFRVQYKQQEFKGSLGPAIGVDWHFKRDALRKGG